MKNPKSPKAPKPYTIVVALPRATQSLLHNEKAKRVLAGKSQTVAEIASELLAIKVDEIQAAA